MGLFDFFTGSPGKFEQVSNLTPEQLRLEKQRRGAASGAFGQAGDYWRDILSNNPAAFAAFEAPEQRRFQEQIIPDLAEQFAGMGAGGLSSSGFRNAAVGAGRDLSERLAAMRAGLRESAASNLYNLGQAALTPHAQYQQTQAPTQGLLPAFASGIGSGLGQYAGNWLGTKGFGSTSPYGGINASGNTQVGAM